MELIRNQIIITIVINCIESSLRFPFKVINGIGIFINRIIFKCHVIHFLIQEAMYHVYNF